MICNKETNNKKYCSLKCVGISKKVKKVIIKCLTCNKEMRITKWELKNGKKYCSRSCASKLINLRLKKEEKTCIICSKKFIVKENSTKKLCSVECQYESFRVLKTPRKVFICLYCDKEFIDKETKERKYCNKKCKDKHHSILYSGKNSSNYGRKYTEEQRKKKSEIMIEVWERNGYKEKVKKGMDKYLDEHNGIWPGTTIESQEKKKKTCLERYGVEVHGFNIPEVKEYIDNLCIERYGKNCLEIMLDGLRKTNVSKIEEKVENILTKNNIEFQKQYRIYFINENNNNCYKLYDFFIPNKNLLIEADGDYWHANPNRFCKESFTKVQLDNIKNDLFKNELAKKAGLKLFRYWETDIHKKEFEQKFLGDIWEEK